MTLERSEDAHVEHGANRTADLADALNAILADVFALYIKTKSFHWHVTGPHFRDYHLLLDEQATQLFAITDFIAERVRKLGGRTLRSIGDIARCQRVGDFNADTAPAGAMLEELCRDNTQLAAEMRDAHAHCNANGDVATAGLLETSIDEAEARVWFLTAAQEG
jgi:starvation-inducible DNA-binding protein